MSGVLLSVLTGWVTDGAALLDCLDDVLQALPRQGIGHSQPLQACNASRRKPSIAAVASDDKRFRKLWSPAEIWLRQSWV